MKKKKKKKIMKKWRKITKKWKKYITTMHTCNLCINSVRGVSLFMSKNLLTLHTLKLVACTIGCFIFIVLLSHLYVHHTHETCTMLSEKATTHSYCLPYSVLLLKKNGKLQEVTFWKPLVVQLPIGEWDCYIISFTMSDESGCEHKCSC